MAKAPNNKLNDSKPEPKAETPKKIDKPKPKKTVEPQQKTGVSKLAIVALIATVALAAFGYHVQKSMNASIDAIAKNTATKSSLQASVRQSVKASSDRQKEKITALNSALNEARGQIKALEQKVLQDKLGLQSTIDQQQLAFAALETKVNDENPANTLKVDFFKQSLWMIIQQYQIDGQALIARDRLEILQQKIPSAELDSLSVDLKSALEKDLETLSRRISLEQNMQKQLQIVTTSFSELLSALSMNSVEKAPGSDVADKHNEFDVVAPETSDAWSETWHTLKGWLIEKWDYTTDYIVENWIRIESDKTAAALKQSPIFKTLEVLQIDQLMRQLELSLMSENKALWQQSLDMIRAKLEKYRMLDQAGLANGDLAQLDADLAKLEAKGMIWQATDPLALSALLSQQD